RRVNSLRAVWASQALYVIPAFLAASAIWSSRSGGSEMERFLRMATPHGSTAVGQLGERLVNHGLPGEQEVARYARSCQCAAVADHNDQRAEALELESVVERVAEPVRPVEERQNAEAKQDDAGKGVAAQRQQVCVCGSRHPARREQQAE